MNLIYSVPWGRKRTQAQRIVERYHLLRSLPRYLEGSGEGGTPWNEGKGFMDQGQLVPDEVVIGIVEERLKRDCHPALSSTDFKTIPQAEALQPSLPISKRPLTTSSTSKWNPRN